MCLFFLNVGGSVFISVHVGIMRIFFATKV